MSAALPLWWRACRLGQAGACGAVGAAALAAVAVPMADGAYRDTSSVAPVLVCGALLSTTVAGLVASPQPEELLGTAARRLVAWRLLPMLVLLGSNLVALLGALVVLQDLWFLGPVAQALCVGAAVTLLGSVAVPSYQAAAGTVAYILAGYFGGGRETWNMVMHVNAPGLALSWLLIFAACAAVFTLRGPAAQRPSDVE